MIKFDLDVSFIQLVSVLNNYFNYCYKSLNDFETKEEFIDLYNSTRSSFSNFLWFCKSCALPYITSTFEENNIRSLFEILAGYYDSIFTSKYDYEMKCFNGEII